MFSKSKRNKGNTSVETVRSVPSIISADLQIFGNLKSAGEVQVDGEVSGDIHSKVLLVGESAIIRGEIIAETVRVHGHVNGQIKAKFVNLAKTANVVGDILHENLSIQEGAFLEGHITHMSDQELKAMDSKVHSPQARQDQAAKPLEDRVNLVVKVKNAPAGNNTSQGSAPSQGSASARDNVRDNARDNAQKNLAQKNLAKAVSGS